MFVTQVFVSYMFVNAYEIAYVEVRADRCQRVELYRIDEELHFIRLLL